MFFFLDLDFGIGLCKNKVSIAIMMMILFGLVCFQWKFFFFQNLLSRQMKHQSELRLIDWLNSNLNCCSNVKHRVQVKCKHQSCLLGIIYSLKYVKIKTIFLDNFFQNFSIQILSTLVFTLQKTGYVFSKKPVCREIN